MLNGERLPDPYNADPVSVAGRILLPAPLRAVLLGALDVRDRPHHSAASMAETLGAAMRQLAAKRRARGVVWFAPALGLLAVPAWIASNASMARCECIVTAAAAESPSRMRPRLPRSRSRPRMPQSLP